MNNDYGKLYLIPSLLGEVEPLEVLPLAVKKILDLADYFIVENEKSARAFIKKVLPSKNQAELEIYVLNKYTEPTEYQQFLEPCLQGNHMGLISEAGAPAVADPGAEIVQMAHRKEIQVVPLSGPSSIFLALMGSGMNGQNFAFHGYLPIDKKERVAKIKSLEKLSRQYGQSQIFMETPYRNAKLFQSLVEHCHPETNLCIARQLTLQDELIKTKSISWWESHPPNLEKRPCIFILDAN